MVWTRPLIASATHALIDATDVSVAELAVVARRDPGAVLAVLELLAACAVAIAEGAAEAEVRARVRLLLGRVAELRATAATRHAA